MLDAAMLALVALILAADFGAGAITEWLWTLWRHRHESPPNSPQLGGYPAGLTATRKLL